MSTVLAFVAGFVAGWLLSGRIDAGLVKIQHWWQR